MTRILKLLTAGLALFTILACGSISPGTGPAPDVATIVAGTLEALSTPPEVPTQAAASTPVASEAAGTKVALAGGALTIPPALATGVTCETVPAVGDQGGGPWEVAPAYIRCTLQGYPLQGKFFQPQIMIYPAEAYAAANEGAAGAIQRLQAILASPSAPLNKDDLPHLPFANAAQVFAAGLQVVPFGTGHGVRALTEYAQYVASINNYDLFYHFQGLTTDGRSYIVAILPINASFLAPTADPAAPVPGEGVAFPGINVQDAATFDAYYQAVTDKLNATSPDAFQPGLNSLDALIGSLEVSQ